LNTIYHYYYHYAPSFNAYTLHCCALLRPCYYCHYYYYFHYATYIAAYSFVIITPYAITPLLALLFRRHFIFHAAILFHAYYTLFAIINTIAIFSTAIFILTFHYRSLPPYILFIHYIAIAAITLRRHYAIYFEICHISCHYAAFSMKRFIDITD